MAIFDTKNEKTQKKGVKKQADAGKKSSSMKDLYSSTAATAKKTETREKKRSGKALGIAYRVLVKPLVTEKVSIIGALNKYGFEVAGKANKIEVAKAFEEVYGIKPLKVNIVKLKGKEVRYGKVKGTRKDKKKAIITLPAGKSIKLYEGV